MISSQPTAIIETVHLSPPQASSSPIPLTVSDSPTQDSTAACHDVSGYTTLPQNCLAVSYDQQSPTRSIDEQCDVASTVEYKYATIISPPHQQHLIGTLCFTQPSTQTSSSSTYKSAHSCSSAVTNPRSHQNQLYKQHQEHRHELLQHQYSALESHLKFPDSTEQFFKSEATDTDNIRSPPHARSESAHYHLHSEQVPIVQALQSFTFTTDINNNSSNNNNNYYSNNLGFTEPSTVSDYSFDVSRKTITGGRISPVETDRHRGKLPPFSALLSSSTSKSALLELSTMMRPCETLHEESDDSGVGSLEEESHFTDLTNVPQTPHDNGHFCGYETHESNFGDWSLSENTILKHEPHNTFELTDMFPLGTDILFADNSDFNMDSPTQDSDECESGRTDRGSYFSFTNTDAYRSVTDVPYIHPYSEHESFISSDSEEPVLEDTLPHFSEIQNHTESDKVSHCMRNTSLSPKKKRKNVRESPSYVEKERRKPGRKPGQVSNVLHLWEFMRDLLHSSESQGIIEWISKPEGVFRVMNSTEVARLWGEKKKNKKKMTYEKLSRSLRYSRLEGYFADLPRDKNYPKKLCFKFGPKSKDWH
ncbi:hypothetical protein BsWGS_18781 [Bradybaena similaris]